MCTNPIIFYGLLILFVVLVIYLFKTILEIMNANLDLRLDVIKLKSKLRYYKSTDNKQERKVTVYRDEKRKEEE